MILAHGLVFDSDIPWHTGRPHSPGGTPDVVARLGVARPVPGEVPGGKLLCLLEINGEMSHSVVEDGEGYLIRWSESAEARIDPTLSRVEMHGDPTFDADLLGVLASGMLTATILQLRGLHVLHASAVQIGASAAAIFGPSGTGKSTIATLAVAGGAPLVTDDVLRVDHAEGGPVVWFGATETRLRSKAAPLQEGRQSRTTADERIAVSLPVSQAESLPLAMLVVPHPDRSSRHVQVVELGPLEGLMALVSAPRILGWRDQVGLATQLDQAGDLCERVPVLQLNVPWGPPFGASLGADIVAALTPYSASA